MTALPIDRTRLYAGAAIIAALNGLALRIAASLGYGSLGRSIGELFGVSAILWLALAAIAAIASEEWGETPSRRDWFAAALIMMAAITPTPLAAEAVIFPYAIFGLMTPHGDDRMRRIAKILLAMSLTLFFGPACLRMFPELLAVDATMAARAIGMHADGNLFWSLDGSKRYLVGSECSSFNNISLATIFMLTLVSWLRLPQRASLIWWTALASLATVIVNIMRLVVLAWRPSEFDYWHHGWGSVIFGWLNLFALGGVVMLAVTGLQRREERVLAAS